MMLNKITKQIREGVQFLSEEPDDIRVTAFKHGDMFIVSVSSNFKKGSYQYEDLYNIVEYIAKKFTKQVKGFMYEVEML